MDNYEVQFLLLFLLQTLTSEQTVHLMLSVAAAPGALYGRCLREESKENVNECNGIQ